MKKTDIFWQTYLNLEKELIEVSKYIFITDVKMVKKNGEEVEESCNTQLETFSPHIADLLIRCCVQIESISKELYYENGGEKTRDDNTILFDEDCLKLVDIKWQTHDKQVLVVAPFFNLTKEVNIVLRPLKDAHRKQGTYWERAYQAVKHDRYASLSEGNVKALIQAMAALYLLNLYMRKDSWTVPYKNLSNKDYSVGSAIFAVKAPVAGDIWYGNHPHITESPYVVAYQEDVFKRIEGAQRAEKEALANYWLQQPELHEPAFVEQMNAELEKQKQNPAHRVIWIQELTKYRLNKLIPTTLPFEKRKSLLIHSEAWSGRVNQQNKHLAPNEITEDNIQNEIELVAIRWGIEIEMSFKKDQWELYSTTDAVCKVYIPE